MITVKTTLVRAKTESSAANTALNFWIPAKDWVEHESAYLSCRANNALSHTTSFNSNTTHMIKTITQTFNTLSEYSDYRKIQIVVDANQNRSEYNTSHNITEKTTIS